MTAPVIFSGLISGVDYESIINALISRRRAPIQALQNTQRTIELKRTLWGEIRSSLNALRDAIKPLLNLNACLPTRVSSSDESIVKPILSQGETRGLNSYRVTILQLATHTSILSSYKDGSTGIGKAVDITIPISQAMPWAGITSGSVTINGMKVDVDVTSDSLNEILERITSVTGVNAAYDAATDRVMLYSSHPFTIGSNDTSNLFQVLGLNNAPLEFNGTSYVITSLYRVGRINGRIPLQDENLRVQIEPSGSFKLNGVEITYDAAIDSLMTLIGRINLLVPSVHAFYDALSDKVVLISANAGSRTILREDVRGNLLDALGLLDDGTASKADVKLGQPALITVDGVNSGNPIAINGNTVNDILNGITLHLVGTGTATISVTSDPVVLLNAIKSFVNAYNATVSLLNMRLSEKPVLNPKNDSERMKGLLFGDQVLFRVRSSLVSIASSRIQSARDTLSMLAHIGIRLNPDGTMRLDEEKLQKALSNDPKAVWHIFACDANGNGRGDSGEDGIAIKLIDTLNEWLSNTPMQWGSKSVPSGLVARQENLLELQNEQLQRHINHLSERLERYAEILRNRFIAAEKAIAILRAQAAFCGTSFALALPVSSPRRLA